MVFAALLILNHPLWPSTCRFLSAVGGPELHEHALFQALCRWNVEKIFASSESTVSDDAWPFFGLGSNESSVEGIVGRRLLNAVASCGWNDGRWHDVDSGFMAGFVCENVAGTCAPASGIVHTAADCDESASGVALCKCWYAGPERSSFAPLACVQAGGRIAEPWSASENARLNRLVNGAPAHIGIQFDGGIGSNLWEYQTRDAPVDYANWYPGEGGSWDSRAYAVMNFDPSEAWCNENVEIWRLIISAIVALLTIGAAWCEISCYRCRVSAKRIQTRGACDNLQNSPYHFSRTGGDFRYALCSCFDSVETCLHVCCCTLARVGDTASAGLGHSGLVLGMWWSVGYFVGGFIDWFVQDGRSQNAWQLGTVAVTVYGHSKRQALRRKFGGNSDKCCLDCLTWWCCSLCAGVQEARQVDEASGLRMACFCDLQSFASSFVMPMAGAVVVGQPVAAQMAPVVPMAVVVTAPPVQPGQANNKFGGVAPL